MKKSLTGVLTSLSLATLSDTFQQAPSRMPQRKTDIWQELIRGKSGRVYGNLIGLLTVMKSLPLAYNKDLKEDKEEF